MEFGVDKCTSLTMNRGEIVKIEGIKMSYENNIKSLDLKNYKYPGIPQDDNIMHTEVKKKGQK